MQLQQFKVLTFDVVGTLISFVTGVPYEPWRTEHAWHHTHQAQLEARFQRPHRVAQGRLRDAELGGRAREALLTGNGDEGEEIGGQRTLH